MTLTGFLIGFILLMGISIAFIKILDSRAIRVLLMTRETHRQEVEMEKESQKSRQRMLEEIQNPDLVMETIIKMKRGEEVSIPLAAFDYIYRNLNKFTLIDKVGKITIVNQEDYFKFKEKALSLMKSGEEKALNIEEVMKEIQEREAKKPIEITKHEDGTVVKTDHVARRTEIIKPNGEKVIINHKTDTMTSIDLIEEKETKEDQKALKEASREKDKKIKALEEENKLNRAKIKEIKEDKKTEPIPQNSAQKEDEGPQETDEEIYNNTQELENENNEINDDKIARKSTKANSISTVPWKQGQLLIEDFPTKGKKEAEEININIEEIVPDETKSVLYPFEDLQSFLKEIVHFKEDSIITQICVSPNADVTQSKRQTALNAHQTHNGVTLNAQATHSDFMNSNKTDITHNELISNADVTQSSVKRTLNADTTQFKGLLNADVTGVCVVLDERTNCILINVHYLFIKLLAVIQHEDRETFITLFYKDFEKGFVNNDTLSTIISFINNKASLSIGSKLFMQEQKENKNLVNFRPVKIIDANNTIYQGLYLYMFTNSGFVKKMINQREQYIFGINDAKVTDNNECAAIKITLQLLIQNT